jgi:hypothetical protein
VWSGLLSNADEASPGTDEAQSILWEDNVSPKNSGDAIHEITRCDDERGSLIIGPALAIRV